MFGDDITYFLFADKDIYFTEHLLKLDYERRIYQLLKKESYEQIFFLEAANGQEIDVICETEASILEYQQKMIMPKFLQPVIAKDQRLGRDRYRLRQKDKDVRGMILRMIINNPNDRYVFVLSKNIMARLCVSEIDRQEFSEKIKAFRYAKGSIFLVTDDKNATGNMPEMPEIILSHEQIQRINTMPGNLARRVEAVAPHRVIQWDVFEKKQMERLLSRVYLANGKHDMKHLDKQLRWLCSYLMDEKQTHIWNMRVDSKAALYDMLCNQSYFERFTQMIREMR